MAGEPSSIIQAPGGDTLRRNFQQIQEGRMKEAANDAQPAPNRNQKPQQVCFLKFIEINQVNL